MLFSGSQRQKMISFDASQKLPTCLRGRTSLPPRARVFSARRHARSAASAPCARATTRAWARICIRSGDRAAFPPALRLPATLHRQVRALLYSQQQLVCSGQVPERLPDLVGPLRLEHGFTCAGFDDPR